MLTPVQVMLINKIMPKGFKLESHEFLIKAAESIKPAAKKQKTNVLLIL